MQTDLNTPPPITTIYVSKLPETPMTKQQKLAKDIQIRSIFIASSLWVAALIMPAYGVTGHPDLAFAGFIAFLFGPFFFDGIIAWFANVLFFVAIFIGIRLRRPSMHVAVLTMSIISFMLSLLCFAVIELPVSTMGGNYQPVYLSYGGYVWMLSLLVMLIGSAISFGLRDKSAP